nr:hypothetical protein CFP56_48989 [Quercus suber]
MSSVLGAHDLHAYDPDFSMTLRYLISIYKVYCFRQGIVSPISDLTQRLLLEERDPPATPHESLYEAPPFDEVSKQDLSTTTLFYSTYISNEQEGSGRPSMLDFSSREDKYDIVLWMKELARKGMAAEVVEEVNCPITLRPRRCQVFST